MTRVTTEIIEVKKECESHKTLRQQKEFEKTFFRHKKEEKNESEPTEQNEYIQTQKMKCKKKDKNL